MVGQFPIFKKCEEQINKEWDFKEAFSTLQISILAGIYLEDEYMRMTPEIIQVYYTKLLHSVRTVCVEMKGCQSYIYIFFLFC